MAIYVLETIDVIGAGRGALIQRLSTGVAPHLEERFAIRLVGIWATAGSTGRWPEANALWEMEDWEQFGSAQKARFPLEDKDAYGCELARHSLGLREATRHDLLRGAPFCPTRAQIVAEQRAGAVVLRENVRSRRGRFSEYQQALEAEFLPVAAAHGLVLLGSYEHALRPNVGINLWSLRDWDHACEFMEGADAAERRRWSRREEDLLEDAEGWLLARPPAGRLGT